MALLAYLDPGSGSLILQVILGLIAAGWVFLRAQWDRVRGLFRRDRVRSTEEPRERASEGADDPPSRADAREG